MDPFSNCGVKDGGGVFEGIVSLAHALSKLEGLGGSEALVLLVVELGRGLGVSALVPVLLVLLGQGLVVVQTGSQLGKAIWTYILETICFLETVVDLPDWSSVRVLVGLSDVGVVGVEVDRDHELCIKVNHSEAWVVLYHGGARATDEVHADRLAGVDGLGDLEVLLVGVAKHREPDDVLVPLHQGLVPDAELVQALFGRDVADNVSKALGCLDLLQLLLEPSNLVSWV